MLVNIGQSSQSILDTLTLSHDLYVHSVFDNGINIKGNDHIIFLGLQVGPSAIHVEERLLPLLVQSQVGADVQYEDHHLIFNQLGLSFDFSQAQVISYQLERGSILPFTTDKVSRMILGYNFETGFGLSTQTLLDTLHMKFEYDQGAYVDYLFGCGIGLTPSGDDFLLGMMAYHHVKPYLNEVFFDRLNEKLRAKMSTDISLNYLNDALQGYFAKPIIDLFGAMQRGENVVARIYTIASFGHSSGKDTLSGIACAILMEQKTRRHE